MKSDLKNRFLRQQPETRRAPSTISMIIFLRRALLFVSFAVGEFKNKVFMECSKNSLLVLFSFFSDKGLKSVFPSPCHSHPCDASLQSRWDLESLPIRCRRWRRSWLCRGGGGVTLSHPRYYLNYFSVGPGSKVPLQVIIMLTHQPEDSSWCISR